MQLGRWLPGHHEGAPAETRNSALCFLRRAPEERRHVEIVRGSGIPLVNHFVDDGTLLCFLHGVGWLDGLFVAPSLPRLWEVGGLLMRLPARRLAEPGGNDGDFHLFFHGIVHHGAENNVGIFVRGLLDDRRGLMYFMESQT